MIAADYTPESLAERAAYLEQKGLTRRAANLWQQIIAHPFTSDELRNEACRRCGVEQMHTKNRQVSSTHTKAGNALPSLARTPEAPKAAPAARVVTVRNADGVQVIGPAAPKELPIYGEHISPAANDPNWRKPLKPKPARKKPKPLTERQKARAKQLRVELIARRKAEAIAEKEEAKRIAWARASLEERARLERAAATLAALERVKEEEREKKRQWLRRKTTAERL